jgi:hypothetical protein
VWGRGTKLGPEGRRIESKGQKAEAGSGDGVGASRNCLKASVSTTVFKLCHVNFLALCLIGKSIVRNNIIIQELTFLIFKSTSDYNFYRSNKKEGNY